MTAFMTRLYSISFLPCIAHQKLYGQTGADFDLESEESALAVTDLTPCWLCIMDYELGEILLFKIICVALLIDCHNKIFSHENALSML